MSDNICLDFKSNDKFRKEVLHEPSPGPELYLQPEIKVLSYSIKDMLLTKIVHHNNWSPNDNTHHTGTVFLHSVEYFFHITNDPFEQLTIGRVF